jgi:tetratricopeptide (TPR) repeat protein
VLHAALLFAPQAQPAPDAELAQLEAEARKSPESASAWKRLGVAIASRRQVVAALPALTKACDLDPKEEDACYFLGRMLHVTGRWDEAREPLERAIRFAPREQQSKIHRAAAMNYMALGRIEEAERHFRQAVALYRGPSAYAQDPRVDFGAFLLRQGRPEEALPLLRQALEADASSAEAHATLGRVLLHLRKAAEAAASLERAVKLDPRSPEVRLLLGRTYIQLGRSEEGRRELQIAQEQLTKDQGSSTVR